VEESILVAIFAVLLVWIAIIAYLIFKDRGVIEHVDMLRYLDSIRAFRPENEEKPDLEKRF
jgi:hypothetical protein